MNIYWKSGVVIALVIVGFLGGCQFKSREIEDIKAAYQKQVDDAIEANRNLEKQMQADADAITVKYQKEQKNAEKTINDLRSRIADGSLRLSVRTESASGMPGGSGAEYPEGRADIDRGTAQALVAITERGDNAIRRLNQCIDQYESIRLTGK